MTPEQITTPRDASENNDLASALLRLLALGQVHLDAQLGDEFAVTVTEGRKTIIAGSGTTITRALWNALGTPHR